MRRAGNRRHVPVVTRAVAVIITVVAMIGAMANVAVAAIEDPGGDFGVCDGQYWVKWEAEGVWESSSDWAPDLPPIVTVEVLEEGDDGPWVVAWSSTERATVAVGVKASTDVSTWPGGTSGVVTGWAEEKDEGRTVEHAISFIVFCFDEPEPETAEVSVTKLLDDPADVWGGELFGMTLTGDEVLMQDLDVGDTWSVELPVGSDVVLTEHEARGADDITITLTVDDGDPVAYTGDPVTLEAGHTYHFDVTNHFDAPPVVLPAEITLVKTADPTTVEFVVGGATEATVTYTYTVTNTGQVPLLDVAVRDDTLGLDVTLGATTLAPGESTTGTLELVVTPEDVGVIDNVATATATTEDERDVSDQATAQVTVTEVSPQVVEAAAIDVTKTPDVTTIAYTAGGDDEVVTYTFVVTNTGEATLFGVTLVDDVLGTIPLPVTTLAAGVSVTVTATHVVTADDVGTTITNVVTATGTTDDDRTVTDTDTASVTVTQVLGEKVTKDDVAETLPTTGANLLPLLAGALVALGAGGTLLRRTR